MIIVMIVLRYRRYYRLGRNTVAPPDYRRQLHIRHVILYEYGSFSRTPPTAEMFESYRRGQDYILVAATAAAVRSVLFYYYAEDKYQNGNNKNHVCCLGAPMAAYTSFIRRVSIVVINVINDAPKSGTKKTNKM